MNAQVIGTAGTRGTGQLGVAAGSGTDQRIPHGGAGSYSGANGIIQGCQNSGLK